MYRWIPVLAGVLAFGSAAGAGEAPPAFTAKPKVAKDGGEVAVSFAVDRSTDVAAYVLDAQGKCVRHLAAGVLGGEKPPPEPLKAGLAQSLEWDGTDDAGNPAPAGCTVKVSLGLQPKMDGFMWCSGRIGLAKPKGPLHITSASPALRAACSPTALCPPSVAGRKTNAS